MNGPDRDSPTVLHDGRWTLVGAVLRWLPDDPVAWRRWRAGDPCGTDRGYQRHKAKGEDACDDCRSARSAKARDYYLRSIA